MKKVKNKKNGFTLFELLVSISIIAVLTAVAVVSFGGVNKRARDSKRISDLEKIRLALEAAKQVGGTYPVSLQSLTTPNTGFLQQIPKDPKTGVIYVYTRTSNYVYQIGASMEDLGSTNSVPFSCGSGGCNYKVTNP